LAYLLAEWTKWTAAASPHSKHRPEYANVPGYSLMIIPIVKPLVPQRLSKAPFIFPSFATHFGIPLIASIMRLQVATLLAFICTSLQGVEATPLARRDAGNLTVALVRTAPVNWPELFWNKNWMGVKFDLPATVDKGVALIHQAAANGAGLVAFPELWFPGYVPLMKSKCETIVDTH
jgi:hypothetical protein